MQTPSKVELIGGPADGYELPAPPRDADAVSVEMGGVVVHEGRRFVPLAHYERPQWLELPGVEPPARFHFVGFSRVPDDDL